jgi:hypothetical protein
MLGPRVSIPLTCSSNSKVRSIDCDARGVIFVNLWSNKSCIPSWQRIPDLVILIIQKIMLFRIW